MAVEGVALELGEHVAAGGNKGGVGGTGEHTGGEHAARGEAGTEERTTERMQQSSVHTACEAAALESPECRLAAPAPAPAPSQRTSSHPRTRVVRAPTRRWLWSGSHAQPCTPRRPHNAPYNAPSHLVDARPTQAVVQRHPSAALHTLERACNPPHILLTPDRRQLFRGTSTISREEPSGTAGMARYLVSGFLVSPPVQV